MHRLPLFALALLLTAAACTQDYKLEEDDPMPEILLPSAFIQKLEADTNIVILDVRTPAEWDLGHVKLARHLDYKASDFFSQAKDLDTNKHYYVYCAAGGRALAAGRYMRKYGIPNVTVLDGGYTHLRDAGYITESAETAPATTKGTKEEDQ